MNIIGDKAYIVNGVEITNPAPVVIPTLCRYNHLRELLDSLSHCHGAEYTDVFIAVDYPLKDCHWDGYRKICEYLDHVGNMGFKKLNVIKRTRNCGIGKTGNYRLLAKEVLHQYDRFITSEDDNVFASGFLDFVNYNLERFKDDKTILSVAGYFYPIETNDQDRFILKMNHFSAWGYGTWQDRYDLILNYAENLDLRKEIERDYNVKEYCSKHRPNLYTDLLGMTHGAPIWGDALCSVMQIHLGLKTVFPSKSLVKNMGWDGSGTHGGVNPIFLNQKVDMNNLSFNYVDADKEITTAYENMVYSLMRTIISPIQHTLTWATLHLYSATGIYYNFKTFRKIWRKIRSCRLK